MANSGKETKGTTSSGGIRLNKRGSKSRIDEEKIKHQQFIIDEQEKKNKQSPETISVYKIVIGTDTFYAAQFPNKKRGELSKVPKSAMKELPYGAKTRSFNANKKPADDLDWQKNINLTMLRTSI